MGDTAETVVSGELAERPTWRPRRGLKRREPQKLTKDRLRLADVELAEAGGVSPADAVWGVIGPGGTYPMRVYLPAPEGGGEGKPPAWRLLAYRQTLIRRCRPEALANAAASAERRLIGGAEAAAETVLRLSRGDMSAGGVVRVLNQKTGEVVEVTSPQAADVALKASEKVLNAVGVATRNDRGGSPSVAVQVNAGDGASVTIFDVLRKVKGAGRRGDAAKRVDAEVGPSPDAVSETE